MFFFKKKKSEKDIILENKAVINKNLAYLEMLIQMSEGKDKIHEELLMLVDKVKYLNPSAKKEVQEADRKITSALEDVKIELASMKDDNFAKVENHITKVKNIVIERDFLSK